MFFLILIASRYDTDYDPHIERFIGPFKTCEDAWCYRTKKRLSKRYLVINAEMPKP